MPPKQLKVDKYYASHLEVKCLCKLKNKFF